MKNWERGKPAPTRKTTPANAKRRFGDFRAGVYMRTLLRDPAAGIMHSLIYFGFLVLLAVTTVLEIDHQLPEDLKFLHGHTYQAYAFVGDLAGLAFVGGLLIAIVRRYVTKPYRIRIKTRPEHALILGVLLAIGLSGFAAEMFRIARAHRRQREHGLRAVELHRVAAQPPRRRLVAQHPRDDPPVDVDRPRRSRSSPSWRSCR